MNPLLSPPAPAAASSESPTGAAGTPERPSGAPSTGSPPAPEQAPPDAPRASCENCGASLMDGQEWCLACGAGVPGSLDMGASWRPVAAIAAVTLVLVAGAAAASYAALTKKTPAPPPRAVASVPAATVPPATSPPATGVPPSSTPGAVTPTPTPTPTPSVPGVNPSTPSVPPSTLKVPKIPLPTPTPGGAAPAQPPAIPTPTRKTTTPTSTTPSTPTTGTSPAAQPEPILLDTDAASTYNPYAYPQDAFGDPSLAIDGDPATSWTARVEPSAAPRMAEGLVIDLKSARRLGSVELRTSTPGIVVEVFGAVGHKLPATITDQAWHKLAAEHTLKKQTTLKLPRGSERAVRYLVVWITKAPAASVGTAQAPGHVALGEVQLFPAGK